VFGAFVLRTYELNLWCWSGSFLHPDALSEALPLALPRTTATVLAALAALHEQLSNDDAFCGYDGGPEATARLLSELWDLVESWRQQSASELVDAWYTAAFQVMEAA